jgi:16S rRNA (uracil1498-N3)-methyltransferase
MDADRAPQEAMSVRSPITALAGGPRTLSGEASHHLCRVLRLRDGDRFVAFDPAQLVEADAVIIEASGSAVRVEIGATRPAGVIALTPLVLVYGLAKGDKVDAVVRDATELGATRIVIARTARAVAKVVEGDRVSSKVERWRRISEQAARQCGRADPPVIDGVLDWQAALDAAAADADARFCLWENATDPLGPKLSEVIARRGSLAFAVGPEGGLTESEVEAARVSGFAPVSLGRFILRTETVAAAVLGAVRILTVP